MSGAIPQIQRLEPRIVLSAGGLDTSYGDGGRVRLFPNADFTVADEATLNQLLPMSDGRLIVAGRLLNGPPYIERFLANGTLDSTFPVKNLEAQFAARGITSIGCAFTPDEKLLISAARSGTPPYTPILLRLTHSGKIDRTFGHNGVAHIPLESGGVAVTLPDGRIVLSGTVHNDIDPDHSDPYTEAVDGIAVLKSNGKLDLRFGVDGVLETGHTSNLDDSLYPYSEGAGVAGMFPLSGGRFLCLQTASFTQTVWGTDDSFHGSQDYGAIDAQIFKIDGTTDDTFKFDRTGVIDALLAPGQVWDDDFGHQLAGKYLATGASQLPDGSVQIAFVIDTVPIDREANPDEHTADLSAYTARIGTDGTISDLKLLQTHYAAEFPFFFRQDDGELLLNESGRFKRFHADGSADPSFVLDGSLNQQYTSTQAAVFSNDGQVIQSYIQGQYPDEKPFLAKIRTSVAPAGVFAGGPIRAPRSTAYRFRIAWHDQDLIDAGSLASPGGVIVYGPGGSTRTAVLLGLEPSNDATTIVATYQLKAPGGTWDAADNGVYTVRTRGRRIFDKAGHSTSARTLARLAVAITR